MLSMDTVLTQILVILLYVAVGFAAGKIRLISPDQRKYLTRICTDLILPFTILSASSQTVSLQDMAGLGLLTLLVLGLFALTTLCVLLALSRLRVPRAAKVTAASLITYPNCTFLGLPLCRALFGEAALLYNAVAMVAFNLLFFTWQTGMFTGRRFHPKSLITAPTVSTLVLVAMLLARLHFPQPVQTVVSNIGTMISPMSLIIIGVMMSETPILAILREKRAYAVTALRNLAVPLVAMLLLRLMPVDGQARLCLLVYLACPCATLSSIYAIQNDMEPEFAARSVLLSTLFFAFTLPAVILLGTRFLS